MNLKRQRRWVSSGEIDVTNNLPLKEFITKVEKIMSGFEPTFQEELEISFEASCDDSEVTMVLGHWRRETDQEMNDREQRINNVAAANKKRELAELARLQEKYK